MVAIGERNEILNETFGHIVWCPLLVAMRQSEARYKPKMLLCMSVTVKWTDWLIELTVIDLPTPSLNRMMLPNMCVCVCVNVYDVSNVHSRVCWLVSWFVRRQPCNQFHALSGLTVLGRHYPIEPKMDSSMNVWTAYQW